MSKEYTRVLVFIKRSLKLQAALFHRCLFSQLGLENSEILENHVHCHLENNKFILELPTVEKNQTENGKFPLLRVRFLHYIKNVLYI